MNCQKCQGTGEGDAGGVRVMCLTCNGSGQATFPTLPVHQVLVDRALTKQEARALIGCTMTEFERLVSTKRLKVLRTSKTRYVVPPQAIRDLFATAS